MKQKWFSAGVFGALVFTLLLAWTGAAGAQAKLLEEIRDLLKNKG